MRRKETFVSEEKYWIVKEVSAVKSVGRKVQSYRWKFYLKVENTDLSEKFVNVLEFRPQLLENFRLHIMYFSCEGWRPTDFGKF